MKRLGDVCDIVGGGTPSKSVATYYSGNIPWATVRDMRSDWLKETECKINKLAIKESATTLIPKGNVVIATRVGLGKVCLLEKDTAINQDLKGLLPKNDKTLDRLFLFHWLKSVSDVIVAHGTGATVQGVKIPFIAGLNIPIPPLAEQKHIVASLDEAFDAIARAKENAEKNLTNARELFESDLEAVFANSELGYKKQKLGEIADIEYGFTDNAKHEGDYRYVRITDIDKNGNLEKGNKVYIASSKEAKKYLLKDGDLLMARTGATYAKVLLHEKHEKSVFASYLIRINFKINLINKLYWYFSKSRIYWEQANKLSSGSAQPQFNGGALKQIVFCFPESIEDQKHIVAKFDALYCKTKELESVYRQKLAALEELKKSILQKAFSGELAG